MLKGFCHCGSVRFELHKEIEWVSKCNCSLCHRLNTLWGHGNTDSTTFIMSAGATSEYIWGDKTIAYHTCRTCGCTTHYEEISDKQIKQVAINCQLVSPSDMQNIRIRHFDGADTWKFLD